MNFITAKKLQCDFALSLIDADRIIREQRRLASRRQWPLTALILCVVLPSVAVKFGDISLPHAISRWMPPW